MIISAINGVTPIRGNQTRKNQSAKILYTLQKPNIEQSNGSCGKAQVGMSNGKKSPSFGIDPFILGYLAIYAGVIGTAVYQSNRQEKQRLAEEERIKKETEDSIKQISKDLRVSYEEAEKYHCGFMNLAAIKPTNDGHEIGLNAVQGYGVEKYRLAVDLIAPLAAKQYDRYISYHSEIPNGVLLYGPTGGGKTYMAEKVCEHLRYLGIKVEDVELNGNNHAQNVRNIKQAFAKAEENFNKTGKYTVINFKDDVDNFFMDRIDNPECVKEVRAMLSCADKCAKRGAVWIGTANNPKLMDSALLRPGRADFKLAIGDMKDFAVGDMIKYTLFKYDEQESTKDFDYAKVIQYMKDNLYVFTPAELELFVSQAKNHKIVPEQNINADMVIAEMQRYSLNDFPTLNERMQQRFEENKKYMQSFDEAPKT